MTTSQRAESVVGTQRPRLSLVPEYVSSAGEEAIELAELFGLELDPWQQYVLVESLGERADGKWAAPDVGLVVPRQNGKGAVLEARELAGLFLFGEEGILHTAHEQVTASDQFRRLLGRIESVPEYGSRIHKVIRGKGSEGIELTTGQRIFFKTRTPGAGRGLSTDCLIYDEAMMLPDPAVAAIGPTVAARTLQTRTGVQTWYTGSAVDQQSNIHGLQFSRIRNSALAGSSGLAYFEWSVEADDPSSIPPEVLYSPESIAQANPGLGIRISLEHALREIERIGPRAGAVERLSVGDWPVPDLETARVIKVADWMELVDSESGFSGDGVIAFDVTPDRTMSTIIGAGRRSDELIHIGVIDRDRGTSWVAGRLAELQHALKPSRVVADASGSVAPLLPEIERHGVEVTLTSPKDYAQACGMIAQAVDDRTIRHLGSPELVAAVAGAATKPLADGWKWSRRDSGIDISPLVAASLALWGLETLEPRVQGVWDLNEVVARLRNEQSPQNEPEERAGGVRFIPL